MINRKNKSLSKQIIIRTIDFLGNLLFHAKTSSSIYSNFIPKNILIVEIWGIGDLILSTSTIVAFKKKYPSSHITILAKPHAQEVLKNCPYIDKYLTFVFPWTKLHRKYNILKWDILSILSLFRQLKKIQFDLAVSARIDIRDNLLLFLSRASKRVSFGHNGGGFFLTDEVKINPNQKLHRIHLWKSILNYLDIETSNISPQLWLTKKEQSLAKDFLIDRSINPSRPIIGIHVGASNPAKCWPQDRYEETVRAILKRYSVQVISFTEPNGYKKDIIIQDSVIISDISLRKLICLISFCTLFICNDGGPMHIAAALNIPTLAIFGPTNPEWFGPWGKKHRVIFKTTCPFHPCSEYCKYDSYSCMDNIYVDEVISIVEEEFHGVLDQ